MKANLENEWITTFDKVFRQGVEKVEELVSVRFSNKEEEENYGSDIQGYFVKAAAQLFEGETTIDKITVGEIYELFQKDETLKNLKNKYNIAWSTQYKNQPNKVVWNAIEYFKKGVEKTKEFILKRFKNEDPLKNFELEDQKLFLTQIKNIINGNFKLSNIDEEDKNEFVNAFSTDEILLALQKNLDMSVVGDTVDNEDSDSSN